MSVGETNCTIQWIVIYPVDSVYPPVELLGPERQLFNLVTVENLFLSTRLKKTTEFITYLGVSKY